VDENFFCRSFIHSFQVGCGESRLRAQACTAEIWLCRNGFPINRHFRTGFPAWFVKEREYAVDNAHLA
jgi:hypothetical protein